MAIVPGKCSETAAGGGGGGGGTGGATFSSTMNNDGGITRKGIMLFGVRLMEGGGGGGGGSSFRKSASMNNLAQFDEQPQDSNVDAAGYASDDVVHSSARSRERKRGTFPPIRLLVDLIYKIIFFYDLVFVNLFISIDFELNRCTVDGGGTPSIFGRIAKGRERRLERNFKKLRKNTNADSGG